MLKSFSHDIIINIIIVLIINCRGRILPRNCHCQGDNLFIMLIFIIINLVIIITILVIIIIIILVITIVKILWSDKNI